MVLYVDINLYFRKGCRCPARVIMTKGSAGFFLYHTQSDSSNLRFEITSVLRDSRFFTTQMITRLLLLILLVFDFVAGIEVQQPGRLRDPAQDIAITIHPEEVRRSPDTIESDKPFGPCTLETDDKDLAPSLSALKRESIQSSQRHHLAIQIPVHGEDSDGDKPPTSHSPSETKASSSLGDGEHGSVNRRKEECTICLVEFDSKLDQPSLGIARTVFTITV
ncbi:hypothetical protein H4Q26_014396 [Puccinia striiformis f. sp. tritici PST-130]|nr:hypothetical protein H4Q26_014396 [Puccinia striiformis f. sp. tritici PST-130]